MGLDNPIHLAFLVIILLLVFGAKRLPELGRSLGSGMRSFKDSVSSDHSADGHVGELPAQPAAVAVAPVPVADAPAERAVRPVA